MIINRHAALAVPFLVIALAACETSPSDPVTDLPPVHASSDGARRFVHEDFQDLTDTLVLFACDEDGNPTDGTDGEWIRLRGGLYNKFVLMTTPAGHIITNYHTMPVGLGGTGEDSGEEFRMKVSNHGNLALTGNGASIPYQYSETLIGVETGRRMKLVQRGMYRVTHDGTVVVEKDRDYVECRV